MRRRQVALGLLLALALAACSKAKDNTELVVTIWSDFAVPSEMDAVRIRVMGKEQTIDHPFRLSADQRPGTYQIPIQLALVPAANKDLSVSIAAIGSHQDTDIVSQEAILPFIPDEARELVLYLARSCKNVSCVAYRGYTCENGACTRPVLVDTTTLPGYAPGRVAPSPDAGSAVPPPDPTGGSGGSVRGSGGVGGTGGGTGVVTVDQAVLNFGPVDVGVTSPPKTVTVTVTKAPIALNAAVFGAGFAISGTTCAAIQPVGTCTISLVFAPIGVGAASGTLNIATVQVALSGTGAPPSGPGVFSLSPELIPLGTMLVGTSAPAVVTITPARTVPSVSCLASGADLTLTSQTCPLTGPVGVPCTYTFTFKAQSVGDKVESIVCSGGGATAQTTVTAKVVTPSALSISPPKQDFVVKVGQSMAWTFNVGNIGGSSTGTLTAAITGAGFAITSNECPAQLGAVATCKIQVTFAPAAASKVTGALTVTDATPGSTPATAALTGTGIAMNLAISPASKDFGTVQVGKSASFAFTMTNSGSAATDIIALASSDTQFTIANDLCSGHPLAAQATCSFGVTFTPTSAGLKQALVNATQTSDGAVLATASLTGAGQAAANPSHLAISPPTLDFGTTGIGVPVGPKVFTITNDGGTATGALTTLKNDSASSVGGASQFNITGSSCVAALAPNATCLVAVTFAPTIARSASAVIVVADGTVTTSSPGTGGTSPPGTVVGIALAIPTLVISCPTAETAQFADTVIGQTSPSVVCTVANRAPSGGDTPQESGALTSTASGDFAISTNNCTTSLLPNLSCTLALVFRPTASGVRTGTLTVTSSNRGAANVPLSGTGLLPAKAIGRVSPAAVRSGVVGAQLPLTRGRTRSACIGGGLSCETVR